MCVVALELFFSFLFSQWGPLPRYNAKVVEQAGCINELEMRALHFTFSKNLLHNSSTVRQQANLSH